MSNDYDFLNKYDVERWFTETTVIDGQTYGVVGVVTYNEEAAWSGWTKDDPSPDSFHWMLLTPRGEDVGTGGSDNDPNDAEDESLNAALAILNDLRQDRNWDREDFLMPGTTAVKVKDHKALTAFRARVAASNPTLPGIGPKDPGFGSIYGDGRPSYITTDGTPVWMWRKGQSVRFYDADGNQVGPEQSNVAPAVAYAHGEGWTSGWTRAVGATHKTAAVGPNGYWCRACGAYQSIRNPAEVKAAKAHLQAHIEAGEQPRDGGSWTKEADLKTAVWYEDGVVGKQYLGFPGSVITGVEASADYLVNGPNRWSDSDFTIHVHLEDGRDVSFQKPYRWLAAQQEEPDAPVTNSRTVTLPLPLIRDYAEGERGYMASKTAANDPVTGLDRYSARFNPGDVVPYRFQPGDSIVYKNWNGAEGKGKVVADPADGMPNDAFVEIALDSGSTFPANRNQLRIAGEGGFRGHEAKTAAPFEGYDMKRPIGEWQDTGSVTFEGAQEAAKALIDKAQPSTIVWIRNRFNGSVTVVEFSPWQGGSVERISSFEQFYGFPVTRSAPFPEGHTAAVTKFVVRQRGTFSGDGSSNTFDSMAEAKAHADKLNDEHGTNDYIVSEERVGSRKTASDLEPVNIANARKVVETQSFDPVTGLDLYSASAITQVYDALNGKNKERFANRPLPELVDLAFKLIKKVSVKTAIYSAEHAPPGRRASKHAGPYGHSDDSPLAFYFRLMDIESDPLGKLTRDKLVQVGNLALSASWDDPRWNAVQMAKDLYSMLIFDADAETKKVLDEMRAAMPKTAAKHAGPHESVAKRAKQAAAKTAMPNPVDLGVEVGDIFGDSWGYDQTNVSFFEVVGLTGASVKVRPIDQRKVDSNGYEDLVVPVPGSYTGESSTRRIQGGPRPGGVPYFRWSSYMFPRLWDGKPWRQTAAGWGH